MHRSKSLLIILTIFFFSCQQDRDTPKPFPSIEMLDIEIIENEGFKISGKLYPNENKNIEYGAIYDNYGSTLRWGVSDYISFGTKSEKMNFIEIACSNIEKNKNYNVGLYAKMGGYVYISNFKSVNALGGKLPFISNISHKDLIVGDTFSIYGKYFSTNKYYKNSVYLGTKNLKQISSTADTLNVSIPYYFIEGPYNLQLKTLSGYSQENYLVTILRASVSGLSKSTVALGDTITIYGNNFSWNKSYMFISLFGKNATVLHSGRNQAKIIIPNISTISSDNVVVMVGYQIAQNSLSINLSPPTITDFFPKTVSAGETITITGSNFSSLNNGNFVWFGTSQALVTAATGNQLKVLVPQLASGSYELTVRIADLPTKAGNLININ